MRQAESPIFAGECPQCGQRCWSLERHMEAAHMQALHIPLTEAEFQSQVVNLAESFGWQWMHIGRTGKHVANGAKGTLGRGWPDLTLVRAGRLIFAELKAQQAPPIPEHQRTVLNHLADVAEIHVWRPSDLPLILEVLR